VVTALITPEGLARLDAALAWIDEHPEQHDQDMWIQRRPECGTVYCLAGVISMQAGAVPLFPATEPEETGRVLLPNGQESGVGDHARGLLTIPWDVSSDLFYIAETRADLAGIRERLAESLESTP
jgi:hypothetical protein